MKVRTIVPKPLIIRDMENMAKRLRALTGEYINIHAGVTAYSSGNEKIEYSLYNDSGSHQYFDDWTALVAEVRRRLNGKDSQSSASG